MKKKKKLMKRSAKYLVFGKFQIVFGVGDFLNKMPIREELQLMTI
ncbi:hypothetical protein [Brachyspira hyodysenteriae]|nr:hypothetical protein [Brachyspira hyodysenteriae]MCZ9966179.1 hypothetical protein [Brachyspira hyodysenteriae]